MAACFVGLSGNLDQRAKLHAKGRAIRALNDMLRSDLFSTSDEAIAGVVKLVNNDFCYGETQHLRVHLGGLREMIRLRGGLGCLGMEGILSINATM